VRQITFRHSPLTSTARRATTWEWDHEYREEQDEELKLEALEQVSGDLKGSIKHMQHMNSRRHGR
jgi:hypothetical protein